jgi:hypothetical protein
MVPESCCIEGADKQKCQGQTIIRKGPPNFGPKSLPPKFESHLHVEVMQTEMYIGIHKMSCVLAD